MIFRDRFEAAEELIPHLEKYKNDEGVILAIPRGGVQTGYVLAKHFKFPLELLLTKKIGHPASSELAIGAVSLENSLVDHHYGVPDSYVQEEIKRIRATLKERTKKFMGDRQPVDLKNKTLILVDDGIATGNTVLAAVQMLKKKHLKKIVVAVPVAPPGTVMKIKRDVDDFICLYTPDDFYGVGQYYEDFSEVPDEEVIRLLRDVNDQGKAASAGS